MKFRSSLRGSANPWAQERRLYLLCLVSRKGERTFPHPGQFLSFQDSFLRTWYGPVIISLHKTQNIKEQVYFFFCFAEIPKHMSQFIYTNIHMHTAFSADLLASSRHSNLLFSTFCLHVFQPFIPI